MPCNFIVIEFCGCYTGSYLTKISEVANILDMHSKPNLSTFRSSVKLCAYDIIIVPLGRIEYL